MTEFVFGFHLGSSNKLFDNGLIVEAENKEEAIKTAFPEMCKEMNKVDPQRRKGFTYNVFEKIDLFLFEENVIFQRILSA